MLKRAAFLDNKQQPLQTRTFYSSNKQDAVFSLAGCAFRKSRLNNYEFMLLFITKITVFSLAGCAFRKSRLNNYEFMLIFNTKRTVFSLAQIRVVCEQ